MSEVSIGSDYEINVFSLSSSDTEIAFTRAVKSFVIQCRDDVDVQVRRNTADSVYWTMKAGSTFSAEVNRSNRTVSTVIGYFRVASGTANLEVMVTF